MLGYAHKAYAASLAEFGTPFQLPRSRGWLLRRRIPATEESDAMGCYPLFCCVNWSELDVDLQELGSDLVSIALVADPFGDHDPELLERLFPDVVRPFKEHFVIDLEQPREHYVSRRHRRNARRGCREVSVEICERPLDHLDDWTRLYDVLVLRHHITGLTAFSRRSFEHQLATPGLVLFRARRDGATVGMLTWYESGEVAYYHLGASDPAGYQWRAPFALFWHAIEYFMQRGLRWLNLGGAAGLDDGTGNGLRDFKAGWSTNTRTAYFCGRILNRRRYRDLAQLRGESTRDYFPSYRSGEFG